jgi:hypothetical protein
MTYFVNFRIWAGWKHDLVETLNNNTVGNFISSLRRVGTQNFNIRRMNYEMVKLVGFSRYDYELESIFLSFFCFQDLLLDAM